MSRYAVMNADIKIRLESLDFVKIEIFIDYRFSIFLTFHDIGWRNLASLGW